METQPTDTASATRLSWSTWPRDMLEFTTEGAGLYRKPLRTNLDLNADHIYNNGPAGVLELGDVCMCPGPVCTSAPNCSCDYDLSGLEILGNCERLAPDSACVAGDFNVTGTLEVAGPLHADGGIDASPTAVGVFTFIVCSLVCFRWIAGLLR